MIILVKLLILALGIIIGRAFRRESDRLEGWDEGFRHGRQLTALQAQRALQLAALQRRARQQASRR